VLYDAAVVPAGHMACATLGNLGHALEFIKDQYRHAKPILALGDGVALVENAGVPLRLDSGDEDPGLLLHEDESDMGYIDDMVKAIAAHRHHAREMDPPGV
jgi:catalase